MEAEATTAAARTLSCFPNGRLVQIFDRASAALVERRKSRDARAARAALVSDNPSVWRRRRL
jgi:hypothetical protein